MRKRKEPIPLKKGDLKKQVDKNLVVKSNALIEASYMLSVQESRLVLVLIGMVKEGDEDFEKYKISIPDLNEYLGIKNSAAYTETKALTEKLLKKVIKFPKPTGKGELQVGWLASADYIGGEGVVELEISQKLKPHLLQLKKRFTNFYIKTVLQLKSSYSYRIYELLKQYSKIGIRQFDLHELRKKLDIPDGKYKLYGHFKSRVLDRSVKEISEKTDLVINYDPLKTGKKITSVKFYIKNKDESFDIGDAPELNEFGLYSEMKSFGLTPDEAQTMLTKYEPQRLKENIEYIKYKQKMDVIKDLKGFVIKSIQKNHKHQGDLFEQPKATITGKLKSHYCLSDEQIKKVEGKYTDDEILDKMRYIESEYINKGKKIKNPAGLLLKALKENWNTQESQFEINKAEIEKKKKSVEREKLLEDELERRHDIFIKQEIDVYVKENLSDDEVKAIKTKIETDLPKPGIKNYKPTMFVEFEFRKMMIEKISLPSLEKWKKQQQVVK